MCRELVHNSRSICVTIVGCCLVATQITMKKGENSDRKLRRKLLGNGIPFPADQGRSWVLEVQFIE